MFMSVTFIEGGLYLAMGEYWALLAMATMDKIDSM